MGGTMNKLPFEEESAKKNTLKVRFDPADYMEHLEGMDLTDAEAVEVLSALWDIMVQFVDLGMSVEFDSTGRQPDSNSELCRKDGPRKNACRIEHKGERRP